MFGLLRQQSRNLVRTVWTKNTINQVTLIGYVGNNPELRTLGGKTGSLDPTSTVDEFPLLCRRVWSEGVVLAGDDEQREANRMA
jgi:single-stranded DNA-binding protein